MDDIRPRARAYIIRMAENFGGEFILADWWFREQSPNISSAKNFSVMSSLLQNHSLCTRLQLDVPV